LTPDPRIDHPVYTLDNREVLPAGGRLRECTDRLVQDFRGGPIEAYPVLRYGSVLDDLLDLLTHPPYSVIFGQRNETVELLKFMEKVTIISPVLESLDYFKREDFYTYRHILMVFSLSTLLALELVGDYGELVQDAASGPMHDFGKICVPIDILRKSEPLSRRERGLLEHHALAGYVLLCYYLGQKSSLSAKVARDHHERRNESGYPRGIKLKDLMVEIVAASDIYDALISPRPYRPTPYENRTALEEITAMAERGELGWPVVQVLVACNREGKPHYKECKISMEKRGTPPRDNIYGKLKEEDQGK